MDRWAVLDFETTGISSNQGDRPTEVAVVLLEKGEVVGQFQSLMNAGLPVNPFVERLTGITTAMVANAPPVDEVMEAAARFVGDVPLVAHNASFDQRFWRSEMQLLGRDPGADFVCTLLLSRRVFPLAPNHKLGTLVQWLGLPSAGRAHRALADAQVAASLLQRVLGELAPSPHGGAHWTVDELRAFQRASRSAPRRTVFRASAP
jgi:DNA polymerase III subunit epsilon